jgi:hypothetical protein
MSSVTDPLLAQLSSGPQHTAGYTRSGCVLPLWWFKPGKYHGARSSEHRRLPSHRHVVLAYRNLLADQAARRQSLPPDSSVMRVVRYAWGYYTQGLSTPGSGNTTVDGIPNISSNSFAQNTLFGQLARELNSGGSVCVEYQKAWWPLRCNRTDGQKLFSHS